jgi:hypothetical protein
VVCGNALLFGGGELLDYASRLIIAVKLFVYSVAVEEVGVEMMF